MVAHSIHAVFRNTSVLVSKILYINTSNPKYRQFAMNRWTQHTWMQSKTKQCKIFTLKHWNTNRRGPDMNVLPLGYTSVTLGYLLLPIMNLWFYLTSVPLQ